MVGQKEPYNTHPHIHILKNLLYQKNCELGNESTEDLERKICRTRGHRLDIQKKAKIETWEQVDPFFNFSNILQRIKYEIWFVKNKLFMITLESLFTNLCIGAVWMAFPNWGWSGARLAKGRGCGRLASWPCHLWADWMGAVLVILPGCSSCWGHLTFIYTDFMLVYINNHILWYILRQNNNQMIQQTCTYGWHQFKVKIPKLNISIIYLDNILKHLNKGNVNFNRINLFVKLP